MVSQSVVCKDFMSVFLPPFAGWFFRSLLVTLADTFAPEIIAAIPMRPSRQFLTHVAIG